MNWRMNYCHRIGSVWMCLAILQLFAVQAARANKWSYHGHYRPEKWHKLGWDACGGRKQSPINIATDSVVYDKRLGQVWVEDVSLADGQFSLTNTGHTVMLSVVSGEFRVRGLPHNYRVAHLHFHWGSDASRGSEHLLDKKAYPFEMHVVSYDTSRYDNINEAIKEPKGLAVLGVFFQISDQHNRHLAPIVQNLPRIIKPNKAVTMTTDWTRLLPGDTSRYYRYDGSLTTPGCHESVVWTVFKDTQTISQTQMNAFRELLEEPYESQKPTTLVDNYRPVQSLNRRVVWTSFPQSDAQQNKMAHIWSYKGETGPKHWAKIQPDKCSGTKQSPINVVTQAAVYNPRLTDLVLFDPPEDELIYTIRNTGHTVQIEMPDASFKIMGGNLASTYTVAQFHFHWGSFDGQGSEHLIDGHTFPLEMHVVAYDSERFGTVAEAMTQEHGLAVLATIYEIQDVDNSDLEPIITALTSVQNADDSRVMVEGHISLPSLLPRDTSQYYRYQGSLTTPACHESVVWTVFKEHRYLSSHQLEKLRGLYTSSHMGDVVYNITLENPLGETADRGRKTVKQRTHEQLTILDNFRPVQPLNGRTVFKSFKGESKTHWSYSRQTGPEQWAAMFPHQSCSGQQQSPINIVRKNAFYDKTLSEFSVNYESVASSTRLSLVNNGHTVKVIMKGNHQVNGGGLKNMYRAVQMHFHWGSRDDRGSEHTINGGAFPIEMHIVTYDSAYTSFSEAVNKPRGLAVLGVLFKITEEDNPILSNLVSSLESITDPDEQNMVEMAPISPRYLLPVDLSRFYRYDGSLTSPGCHESVIWTIFTERVPISRKQLKAFRGVMTSKKYWAQEKNSMKESLRHNVSTPGATDPSSQEGTNSYKYVSDNLRPVQPINHRKIFKSFTNSCVKIYRVGNKLRCIKYSIRQKLKSSRDQSQAGTSHDSDETPYNVACRSETKISLLISTLALLGRFNPRMYGL